MFIESISAYNTITSNDFKVKGNMFMLRHLSRSNADGDGSRVASTYEHEGIAQSQAIASATSISSDTNSLVGSFFVSIGLAAYKQPLMNQFIYSGVNTVGADVFVETSFGGAGTVANSLFDYYCNYSAVLNFSKESGEFSVVN